MTHKYTLIHEHEFGITQFHFQTNKEFTLFFPIDDSEWNEEHHEFLHKLGVDFDEDNGEFINIVDYEEPKFINID